MLSFSLVHATVVLLASSSTAPTPQSSISADQGGALGYYRMPAIHGDSIVFTAEGDLWKTTVHGGLAQRLTTHPSTESHASISPDGRWLAFSAAYEGPNEVYVMPVDGGLPSRCTFGGGTVVGWTPGGQILFETSRYATLPNAQLCAIEPRTHKKTLLPLSQASDGSYSDDGRQLFFTRFSFQGSQTKRYKGGTAQNIWRWDGGTSEAKPLTADFTGTSRSPMYWHGRVYFASDRDGVMNIWSMDPNGHSLKEHTHHADYDVLSPSLDGGRIVYQHGADLCVLDLARSTDEVVPIRLASDFDQMRETWVKSPLRWTSAAHVSPDGTKVALTARGEVFVAPVKQGRLVQTTRGKDVRYRDAQFSSDGKSLIALSDASGEVELWKLDPLGTNDVKPTQLTNDGKILRLEYKPSPDGKWIAHADKSHRLYLYDVEKKSVATIVDSQVDDIYNLTWSPDSHYLAFLQSATNLFDQLKLYTIATGKTVDITTDRYNSANPAFTSDGKFLFFLSDRNLQTVVGSPWGSRAPEPFFDRQEQVCYVPLQPGNRSPFQADDELYTEKKPAAPVKGALPAIDVTNLTDRIEFAPIAPGNYRDLTVCGDRLYFMSQPAESEGPASLVSVAIRNRNIKTDTILGNVEQYEVTPDQKKIMARAGGNILVFDANGAPPDAGESKVNLDGWTFSFDPKEEWRQMFDDAWRLHRDYLYAPNMQGVDWPAMRKKYRPLVDRVTDRDELSDLLAQMVGEVSLLHTFVYGGDHRPGTDSVEVAALGAAWERDERAGGYRLTHLYRTDPDMPDMRGPLMRQGLSFAEGDVIAEIDGVPTISVGDAEILLRAKAGKQIRVKFFPSGDRSKSKEAIVEPISAGQDWDLRYSNWEYSRRLAVEKAGKGSLGYVHLRAMGGGDYNQWERDFYPVFNRDGLIIDVRHNGGGNIDSWVLEKLMRKVWMLWNQHKGASTWNMQFAFRGKLVVLCDENTASDGEAFTEGFRRLGLGAVIGTRTWGGEVWLSGSNRLVDGGVATAAESGVYGPEGKWLIEGHGVDPDIVVDNLPHETFAGKDAQLEAAIKYLQDEIAKHPNPVPPHPAFPDKSLHPKRTSG
ncbi:MAG: S41 family peptidase [Fimbriimonas sp.]|nr:S41 family peptidase [Fimbriimonas sp.]